MLRIAGRPTDTTVSVWSSDENEWRTMGWDSLTWIRSPDPYKYVRSLFKRGMRREQPHALGLPGIHRALGVGLGVLYDQSCKMRMDEAAAGANLYSRKFWDTWPERFLKFMPGVPGLIVEPGGNIGIAEHGMRVVSETELGVMLNVIGKPIAYAMTNDVTDSGYEGQNIINLPVSKTFPGCFSGGPWWTVFSPDELEGGEPPQSAKFNITVRRGGEVYFAGEASWSQMSRPMSHLVEAIAMWLGQDAFRGGIVAQTGTGIIMGDRPHKPGDEIEISSDVYGSYTTGAEIVPTWRPEWLGAPFELSTLAERFERRETTT